LYDAFESDKFDLSKPLLSETDSLAVRVFFDALLDKKKSFETIVRGGGIGKWNGFQTVIDRKPENLSAYPGNTKEDQFKSKTDSSFLRLRCSQVFIKIERFIQLEVNSFTDPVSSNFNVVSESLRNKQASFKLSNNEILSAYRSREVLLTLKKELNQLAGAYLSREEAKIVIDRLNKEIDNARIAVGRTSFPLKDF
jgi:hypothetical protein